MQSLIVCLSLQLPSHPQGQQQQHGPCPAVSACGEEDDPFLFEDACGAVEEYRRQAEETLMDLSRALGLEAYLGQVGTGSEKRGEKARENLAVRA